VPRLCELYPGICLTTEEKARKNLSQGKKNLSQVKKNLSQSTEKPQSKYTVQYAYYQKHPHITKPSQTHTLQNPLIHTLQNNIKPPQYKLKQNAHRKSNIMGRKNSTQFLMLLISEGFSIIRQEISGSIKTRPE